MVDNESAVGAETTSTTGTVSQTYDWSATHPSTAVVETVSAATDTEPTNLDTLQYAIDADALDTILQDSESDSFEVSFKYAGTGVLVSGDGTVRVALD
ncbi:HalOD1 output domain-containing protein [Salinibaculum salinum]|uniref:HalOD1 output domain-containing protein n=1 Tax=Salinibaculum salinum TaxID=3131996 RepID=UPI0030EDBDB2